METSDLLGLEPRVVVSYQIQVLGTGPSLLQENSSLLTAESDFQPPHKCMIRSSDPRMALPVELS